MKRNRVVLKLAAVIALSLGVMRVVLKSDFGIISANRTTFVQRSLTEGAERTKYIEDQVYIFVDNKYVSSQYTHYYLSATGQTMVLAESIRDILNCYIDINSTDKIAIQRNGINLEMVNGNTVLSVNENEIQLRSAPQLVNGQMFIPLEAVATALGYDVAERSAMGVLKVTSTDELWLPARYDYREEGRAPQVKNQENFGTCWAVASLSALESTLLPGEEVDLAADHMSIRNHFVGTQNDGGDYTMSMAYLAGWQGPIPEALDPYGDEQSPEDVTPSKHVQEIRLIGGKKYQEIKEAIYKYGAVQSSFHFTLENPYSESIYYNNGTSAYCYTGEEAPNHDIIVIGWDDDYPAENFNVEVGGNGAFICQNSWGTDFGEDGIFYISYYDTNMGNYNVVYTKVEEIDNYDNIYQTDLCGWVGQMGYYRESAYAANVYTTGQAERLRAIGFYSTAENTEYEIYVVRDFEGSASLRKRTFLQKGKVSNAGFYTVELNVPVDLEAGEKYAIVMKITTLDNLYPIAIECQNERVENLDLMDGEGYISDNGLLFERTEEQYDSNVCLKAYTDNLE